MRAMARNRAHATAHATLVHPWSMPKPPATGGSRIPAARGPTSCPAALMHLGVSQSERPSRGGAERGHVWHPSASPRTKSAPSYVPADKRGRRLRGNFSQDLVELHSNGLPLLGAVQAPLPRKLYPAAICPFGRCTIRPRLHRTEQRFHLRLEARHASNERD